jgi:hypothetical protein
MKRTLLAATRALSLALVWSLASPAQRAVAAELRIDWTAPPECSFAARDMRARVMKLVGGAAQSNLVASVELTRGGQGYRAHVVLRGPAGFGERRLEDAHCDVLADSVAVLIALSIPSPNPDAGELWLALSPEARLSSGPLPLTAAGLGGAIAVEGLGWLRLELGGAYYFPQSTTFEPTSLEQARLGGRFKLFTVGANLCRLWSFGALQWGPCVGAEVHHISATGFGGITQLPGSTTWWGPSLRLFARVQFLPVLGIHIAVEGLVPISRPQFVFSDVGELHRVGLVAFQLSVGPEVRF